jgi:uncharacterized protein (DUF1800 family)
LESLKNNFSTNKFPAIGLYLDYVVSIGKNNSAEQKPIKNSAFFPELMNNL